MHSRSHLHRHAGPKSPKYNELEALINGYYDSLKKNRSEQVQRFAVNIRKHVLLHGCAEDDIIPETTLDKDNIGSGTRRALAVQSPSNRKLLTKIGGALPAIRKVEDTLRGKLWRLSLGVANISANEYQQQIRKAESRAFYVKIRNDTKRTFLTSEEYNSRVSEERLVRVLNSYVHRYGKPYCQGMDAIAAGLLYVMPELDAFASLSLLINDHFPTYFYSDRSQKNSYLVGAYAASFLANDVMKVCDLELYKHLKPIQPWLYYFPCVASFQAISQPFTELLRLWDFLFCFGVHLNPVLAAAQIIVNRKKVLQVRPAIQLLQGILSQRKWMFFDVNAGLVISTAMSLIMKLRSNKKHAQLWDNIIKHASDKDLAIAIKAQHVSVRINTPLPTPLPSGKSKSRKQLVAGSVEDFEFGEQILPEIDEVAATSVKK